MAEHVTGYYTRKNILWVHFILGFLVLNVLMGVAGTRALAASVKEITGVSRYDYAFQVLEKSNAARVKQGKNELTMDKELLEDAMCRAAECAINFDHIRPNGQNCFAMDDKIYAENLAAGQETPKEVVADWLASSGHRTNLLNKDYKSIGVGCFEYKNTLYWVQLFGYAKASAVGEPATGKTTYQIALSKSAVTKSLSGVEITSDPLASKVANVKLTAGKKKLTLKWAKKSGISGYQVQISNKKSFSGAKTYTLASSKKKLVIKKYNNKSLKSKKKYYVRIRAYIETNNSSGSDSSADGTTIATASGASDAPGATEVSTKYSKWKTVSKKTK